MSPLDMFAIGIGPSSSHTVGPMKAGLAFAKLIEPHIEDIYRIKIELFGSLALTGEGHGTFLAVLNGLSGYTPKTISSDELYSTVSAIQTTEKLLILNKYSIDFHYEKDLIINKEEFLPQHANGMRFTSYTLSGEFICKEYFSIGGGFILDEIEVLNRHAVKNQTTYPYVFTTGKELFDICNKYNMTVAEVAIQNELTKKTKEELYNDVLELIHVMRQSIQNGIAKDGILPGGLMVRRRAKDMYEKLTSDTAQNQRLLAMVYAIAVNEENASFNRVVTAPTNGAAGTIPAVLEYYINFINDDQQKQVAFILTAGCIGTLYKYGASISAAEVGCQGEIGVACSMAAAALTAVLGGNIIQVEKAAEIGMEHFLGMTCDPVNGLVQIPCIERNAVATSKAIDIAYFAMLETVRGKISLDHVIATMFQTGKDMSMKYKETSIGGLSVNIPSC